MPPKKEPAQDLPDIPVKKSGLGGNLLIKSSPPEITITGPVGIYRDGQSGDKLVLGIFGVTLDARAQIVQAGGPQKTRTYFSDGKLYVILEGADWDKTPVEISFNLTF
jgi:hypothetical protein